MSAVLRPPQRHRYSVQDYYRMAETGILPPQARVELIEGEIVDMTPIGSRHSGYTDRLSQLLFKSVESHAIVRVQSPIHLGTFTEPQPDITLLRAREDFYSSAHPTSADILLVIEISDSSLDYDRGVKLPLYAQHGIPECWLVNLNDRVISRHFEPGPAGYQRAEVIQGNTALPGLDGCSIELPVVPA